MQCLLNVYDRAKDSNCMSRTCNENIQSPNKSGANVTGYEAMEHAQTVCTRLFSVKKPKTEEFQKVANKPAARLQIDQLLLELYSVVKKKAQGF